MKSTLLFTAGLVTLGVALPMPVAEPEAQTFSVGKPVDTIELGKPSTEITWGRRDAPKDTIELGKPSTEITWGKRGLAIGEPADTIELGKPGTEIVWGKE